MPESLLRAVLELSSSLRILRLLRGYLTIFPRLATKGLRDLRRSSILELSPIAQQFPWLLFPRDAKRIRRCPRALPAELKSNDATAETSRGVGTTGRLPGASFLRDNSFGPWRKAEGK